MADFESTKQMEAFCTQRINKHKAHTSFFFIKREFESNSGIRVHALKLPRLPTECVCVFSNKLKIMICTCHITQAYHLKIIFYLKFINSIQNISSSNKLNYYITPICYVSNLRYQAFKLVIFFQLSKVCE
jgi:hypothetical protein